MPLPLTDVCLPALPAGPGGRYGTEILARLGGPVPATRALGEPPAAPTAAIHVAMTGAALAGATIAHHCGWAGAVDGPAFLDRERPPGGRTARILTAADGMLAVNLPRPSDWDLVPAWLHRSTGRPERWADIADAVRSSRAAPLAARAGELGLAATPCPAPGRAPADEQNRHRHPAGAIAPWVLTGAAGPTPVPIEGLQVVDLSALWAGPLLGSLLAGAGATVTKVEDPRRRDASRPGATALSQDLNRAKTLVEVPFDHHGRDTLAALLAEADVVIEGSRPRVLDGLGLGPAAGLRAGQVWVSITAFGRTGPWSGRVGYGDDTAAAGGLYAGAGHTATFVGDAVADPLTGLHGAVAVLAALAGGWSGHIDLALRDTAAMTMQLGTR